MIALAITAIVIGIAIIKLGNFYKWWNADKLEAEVIKENEERIALAPITHAQNKIIYMIDRAKTYDEICAADEAIDDFIDTFYDEKCIDETIIKLQRRFEKRRNLVRKWDRKRIRVNMMEFKYSHE